MSRPRHKSKFLTSKTYKDMMAESKAYAKAGAACNVFAEIGAEGCKDKGRSGDKKKFKARSDKKNESGKTEPQSQPQSDALSESKPDPEPPEQPRVPPIIQDDRQERDKTESQAMVFNHLEEGLKSIYNERATWVKMTFPTLEEAIFYSMTKSQCIQSFYKSFGKVIVSPSRCKVISPPHSIRPCNEYTAWVVGKIILNPDREGFLIPSDQECKRGINISRSQLGWSICNLCAYTYGHLGPHCINTPEHKVQTMGDYARYEAIKTAKQENNGVINEEIRKKLDVFKKERPRDRMTTPFISKNSNSCIYKQTALWHEPLADFYHQMEFDAFNLLHGGVKNARDRRFVDYGCKENLYGFRHSKIQGEYLDENSSYIVNTVNSKMDWQRSKSFRLPPFDPFDFGTEEME